MNETIYLGMKGEDVNEFNTICYENGKEIL